jgi:hypothetical protein
MLLIAYYLPARQADLNYELRTTNYELRTMNYELQVLKWITAGILNIIFNVHPKGNK